MIFHSNFWFFLSRTGLWDLLQVMLLLWIRSHVQGQAKDQNVKVQIAFYWRFLFSKKTQDVFLDFFCFVLKIIHVHCKLIIFSYIFHIFEVTVKTELTTTSEYRPPVYNNHHFEVPFGTIITLMISKQRPLSTTATIFGSRGWSVYKGLTVLQKHTNVENAWKSAILLKSSCLTLNT